MYSRRSLRSFCLSKIPVRKLYKNRKILGLTILVLIVTAYVAKKSSLGYVFFKLFGGKRYDLNKDALQRQNIYDSGLTCRLAQTDTFDTDDELIRTKYAFHQRYLVHGHLNADTNVKIFNLNVSIELTNRPEFVRYLVENLKLCTTRSLEENFVQQKVAVERTMTRLGDSLLHGQQVLDQEELKLINSNQHLPIGGLYTSPICVQHLLGHFGRVRTLEMIRNKIGSKVKVENLLDEVSRLIRPVVASLISSNLTDIERFVSRKRELTVVLVPFLNRNRNLVEFLFNLHAYLQRKFISYVIVVVEQTNGQQPFNKGRLYNAGYWYVLNRLFHNSSFRVGCVILHDVDLYPDSDFNLYECDSRPKSIRHLSVAIKYEKKETKNKHEKMVNINNNKQNLSALYDTNYEFLIGGVVCIKPYIYESINGFSNQYFNWGGEDDDFAMRIKSKDYCVRRSSHTYSRYRMSKHNESKKNPLREIFLFSSVKRMKHDGLSDINQLVSIQGHKLYAAYTKIHVDVGSKTLWQQIYDNVIKI